MPQKIYYGNAIIEHTKTGKTQIIEGVIYTDLESLNDKLLRGSVLKKFKPLEREQLQIIKLCFDTAKYLGLTAY